MKYPLIMFDFDGTLVDSGSAIMASMRETFRLHDQPVPSETELRGFIGPPPQVRLMRDFGFSEEKAWAVVADYRKVFGEKYWKLAVPYPGAVDMLKALKGKGARLAIATTRPRDSAMMLMEAMDLVRYFDHIATSPESGAVEGKTGQISEALTALKADRRLSCMVGDRVFDLEAAFQLGVDGVFAAYGYGNDEEVAPFNPKYSARSLGDLCGFLMEEA